MERIAVVAVALLLVSGCFSPPRRYHHPSQDTCYPLCRFEQKANCEPTPALEKYVLEVVDRVAAAEQREGSFESSECVCVISNLLPDGTLTGLFVTRSTSDEASARALRVLRTPDLFPPIPEEAKECLLKDPLAQWSFGGKRKR